LSAIRNTVSKGTQVTYSANGSGATGADIGIVVAAEPPYAEGAGDRGTLALPPEDLAVIHNLKAAGIPVAVVLISGRPIPLALDSVDAVMAAWLPGTEGQGIADVLFGDYKPTGKLSYKWADRFKVGYGLTY